ncbi:hypothetical protein BgiMline_025245, partial [Biomphalaria glabrata]
GDSSVIKDFKFEKCLSLATQCSKLQLIYTAQLEIHETITSWIYLDYYNTIMKQMLTVCAIDISDCHANYNNCYCQQQVNQNKYSLIFNLDPEPKLSNTYMKVHFNESMSELQSPDITDLFRNNKSVDTIHFTADGAYFPEKSNFMNSSNVTYDLCPFSNITFLNCTYDRDGGGGEPKAEENNLHIILPVGVVFAVIFLRAIAIGIWQRKWIKSKTISAIAIFVGIWKPKCTRSIPISAADLEMKERENFV